MTPILSIIIPTYNSGKHIAGCLESIAFQTFTNVEVIIQDGCSTDDTMEIVNQYVSRYPTLDILSVSEKDYGIYDAMNKSLMKASGQYVYFLGSDDRLYDKNVLNAVFTDPSNLAYDVIYGNVYSTRFNGVYDGEFDEHKLLKNNICHQGVFFKKDVFDKTGFFDLKYKGNSDWDHNFKWFFSPLIKKKFIDVVIAEYADGGFSSHKFDWAFEKDRIYKYLLLRKKTIPFSTRRSYIYHALKTAIKRKDFIHALRILVKTSFVL